MAREGADLVAYSWKRLGGSADLAAGLFYDRLFEIAPATRSHFAAERMPDFRRELVAAIERAVTDPAGSRPARRDLLLGAGEGDALAALIWTVRSMLGDAWTPALESAWRGAGRAIVAALRPEPTPTA